MLLRVLQERTVRRTGGEQPVPDGPMLDVVELPLTFPSELGPAATVLSELRDCWRNGAARARLPSVTSRAHKVLEEALALSEDERLDLAEQLLLSLPADPEWFAELERRARGALADPSGGEAWEVVERRLDARFASR